MINVMVQSFFWFQSPWNLFKILNLFANSKTVKVLFSYIIDWSNRNRPITLILLKNPIFPEAFWLSRACYINPPNSKILDD